MKRKNSITQKRELERRLQKGQDRTIIKYGLDQEELQLAKEEATKIAVPFSLVEAILAAFHTACINTPTALSDKEVQHLLIKALEQQEENEISTGLFQSIAQSG